MDRRPQPRFVAGPTGLVLLAALVMGGVTVGHAYVTYGSKWSTGKMTYYVNPANSDGIAATAVEAALRAGADAWPQQSSANFSFVYGGRTSSTTAAYNQKNDVFFRNESSGGTIAVTYYWHDGAGHLLDADILFYDAGFVFYTGTSGCSGSGIYVEDPATHEFGHALGLAHTSVSGATMVPSMGYCSQAWRTLESDDVAGVESLYPPVVTKTPPAAPTNVRVAAALLSNPLRLLDWLDRPAATD